MIESRPTTVADLDRLPATTDVEKVRPWVGVIQGLTFHEGGRVLGVMVWYPRHEGEAVVGFLPGEKFGGVRLVVAARRTLRRFFFTELGFNTVYTESLDTASLLKWHTVLGFKDMGLNGDLRRWVLIR